MITFAEATSLCKEIKEVLSSLSFASMRESSEGKWLINFNEGEREKHLLVCVRTPFERFHLAPAHEGRETPFTKKIEEELRGSELTSIALLGEDRILELQFKGRKKGLSLILELIPRHSNLYLVDEKRKILLSFRPAKSVDYSLPPRSFTHESEPHFCSSPGVNAEYAKKEREALREQKIHAARAQLVRQIRKQEKRVAQLRKEREEAENWPAKEHEAALLQSSYFKLKHGMSRIDLEDWETGELRTIELDPSLEPSAQLKRVFGYVKKLKTKVSYVQKFLERAESELALLQKRLETFEDEGAALQLEELPKPESKPPAKKEHSFREYTSEKGLKIYVAKSAKQNEELTFSFGRGLDYWLHVSDFAGSHVIVRGQKREEPDQETLLDAAQLALYYSKARGEKVADVTLSQVKFLTRGKKMGQVGVGKYKTMTIRYDPERLARLQNFTP
ncbi:MAG: DUF814 domain-containing protein [Chlamydiales bacterium]|nr:DUF814 domain-containing protein [Chlamydiales bacterium]